MSMMPGIAGHPRHQSRQRAEEYFSSAAALADAAELRRTLYARECGVQFELGTVALYQLNVWHRGTPVTTVRQQLSQILISVFDYDRQLQMRDTKQKIVHLIVCPVYHLQGRRRVVHTIVFRNAVADWIQCRAGLKRNC